MIQKQTSVCKSLSRSWSLFYQIVILSGLCHVALAIDKDSKEMTTLRKAMFASLGLAAFLFAILAFTIFSRWCHNKYACCRRCCNVPCWSRACCCCIRCGLGCQRCLKRHKQTRLEKKQANAALKAEAKAKKNQQKQQKKAANNNNNNNYNKVAIVNIGD